MDISPRDLDMMTRTVMGEVDPKDPDAGRAAVAHVIMNRVQSGNFGKSPTDVVLQKNAFEPWSTRAGELAAIDPNSPDYQRTAKIVSSVASGDTPDPTSGATFFYSPKDQAALGRKAPSWAQGQPLATIGGHAFYGDTSAAPAPPVTAQSVLARYGTPAPQASPQAPAGATASDILQMYGSGSGTVARAPLPANMNPPKPTVVPTPREAVLASQRGLPAQFAGGMPIIGPAFNALTAAASATPGATAGTNAIAGALAPNAPPGASSSGSWWDNAMARWNEQNRADKYFAQQNPGTSTLAQFAGGAATTLPFGATGVGARLLGVAGPSWGSRVYMGGIGGGLLGGLDAGMRGENPVTGATLGAAGGVLGPTLGVGAGAGMNAIAGYAWPRPDALRTVPRAGINLLSNALEGETDASLKANIARMGPAGFLSDLNPGMTDIAGAIADTPGPGKALVRAAFQARAADQGNRIDGALTQAFGPKTNIVDYQKSLIDARKAAADPLYDQWRSMQVQPTDELKAMIPRLDAAGAFDQAEKLSGITGEPINRNFFTGGPQKAYPTTQTWDYVKRGLDSNIDQAYAGGDKTMASALIGLKQNLIDEIGKTPAGQVWNQARQAFAEPSALIDQVAAGRDTFIGGRSGTSVDEMNEELKGLSRPEIAARIQGARSAASEAMGATANGDTRLRTQLLAPNNQEKLRLLLGQKADPLIAQLNSEKFLNDQGTNVIGNMSTGASGEMRSARRKMFEAPDLPEWGLDLTKPGTYLPPPLRPGSVLQSLVNEQSAKAAPSLAPIMLTPQGPKLNDLLSAVRGEQARLANVQRVSGPWASRLGGLVSGPGSSTYRRYYENQQQ